MENYKYLDNINYPEDLRKLKIEDLPTICDEIREFIIDTLSGVGGHFASNLGVVELTVAIHYIFNTPIDRLIWDVGHQTYPHKVLTGRKKQLKTVRKFKGISGFPKREESNYDTYNTGHAGTSISQLLGEAVSRDLLGKDYKCLAVIGDASIATGMALEAMNHGGHIAPNCLVILNDNYMSISKNVGSISTYLNNIISSHLYNKWKRLYYTFLKWLPIIGPALREFSKKMERSFKYAFTPGGLFEDLGFVYIGPVDGHDIIQLVKILSKVKDMDGPILLHVISQKGKGYVHAENDPIKYHGVTPFDKLNGNMVIKKGYTTFSNLVGETLTKLTEKNPKVVAITPAMIEGSGLNKYSQKFPKNVFDVGIAEQHSVAFAASLLGGGLIPFMCIYSTFMTRALDQMVHDVSLMNLPVRFIIDRAGCVGPDGETHQGLFDLGYLCSLPYMYVISPSNAQSLLEAILFMEGFDEHPIAVRFPKANELIKNINMLEYKKLEPGKSEVISKGEDITILAIGSMVPISLKVKELLEKKNISSTIVDLLWIRPLDLATIHSEISNTKRFVILDESYLDSGASGYILNRIEPKYLNRFLKTYAFPPEPILHGERNEVLKYYELDEDGISNSIFELFKESLK